MLFFLGIFLFWPFSGGEEAVIDKPKIKMKHMEPFSKNGEFGNSISDRNEEIKDSHINKVTYNKNDVIVCLSETSYSKPFQINSSWIFSYQNKNLIFFSNYGTQYIKINLTDDRIIPSLHFNSICIRINTNELNVFNLTLFESPTFSTRGKINIKANYFQSDYQSIPSEFISNVFVSNYFYVIDNNQHNNEPHAQITLLNRAKQSLSSYKFVNSGIMDIDESNNNINDLAGFYLLNSSQLTNKINENKMNPYNAFNYIRKLHQSTHLNENVEYNHESEFFSFYANNDYQNFFLSYEFNDDLRNVSIHDDFVTVAMSNLTQINLTSNITSRIAIATTSKQVILSCNALTNFNNYWHFALYLLNESTVVFDQTFDSKEEEILQTIIIVHEKQLTATSATSVPYVVIYPVYNVNYIPSRKNTENYCMCARSNFDECVSEKTCLLYSVPESNYFVSTNSTFLTSISRSKYEIINIYVTDSIDENSHRIDIKQSLRGSKSYNFIPVHRDSSTIITVSNTNFDDSYPISLSFTDISTVNFDIKTGNVDLLILKNSPINIGNRIFEIQEVKLDASSLTIQQNGMIKITKKLHITSLKMNEAIGMGIMLANNSELIITTISEGTTITISNSIASFSNGEYEFLLYMDIGYITFQIEEKTNSNPLLKIVSSYFNPNINLNLIFRLENSLSISFEEATPLPENIIIDFQPVSSSIQSLSLIMPEYLNDFNPNRKIYNFKDVTGEFNLILLNPITLISFLSSVARGDFYAGNLSGFSMNVIDLISKIELYSDYFNILLGTSLLQVNKSFVVNNFTIITNTTNMINISLNENDHASNNTDIISSIFESDPSFSLTIQTTANNTNLYFDKSFQEVMYNNILMKYILITHKELNVTLSTELDVVPPVAVENKVDGVLYRATSKSFILGEEDTLKNNYRSGPDITVVIESSNININQSDFLAEHVTFKSLGNRKQINFYVQAKSLVNYSFDSIGLRLLYQSGNTFQVYSLSLLNSPLLDPFVVQCDYFRSYDFVSITGFGYISCSKLCELSSTQIDCIEIDNGTIVLTSLSLKTARFKSPYFKIYFNSNKNTELKISIVGHTNSLANTFIEILLLGSEPKTIFFDLSWDLIEHANHITIVMIDKSNLTIRVQLMELPPFNVIDSQGNQISFNLILYKPVFTSQLAFILFGAFALLILFVSLILLIVGSVKYHRKFIKTNLYESNNTELDDINPHSNDNNSSDFIIE